MIRRRSPLRFVFRILYALVVCGVIYYVQGPMQAKKEAYRKEFLEIGLHMRDDQQKASDALDKFQKLESPQDADWATFADSSEALSKDFDGLGKQTTALEPPREYKKQHEQMVSVLRINSQTYSNLAKAARDHDRNRMRDVVVDGNKLTQDLSSSGQ